MTNDDYTSFEEEIVLTVTNSQVLELTEGIVAVYDTDGLFVRSFGEGILKFASDMVSGRFANVSFANVLGRFANVLSRFANVLLVNSPTSK